MSTLFKINNFLKEEWLPFLNLNIKWGVSLFLRVFFITITFISIILLLKISGIFKDLREIALQDIMGVSQKSTSIISVPDINYSSDIEDLKNLIKNLENSKITNEEKNK